MYPRGYWLERLVMRITVKNAVTAAIFGDKRVKTEDLAMQMVDVEALEFEAKRDIGPVFECAC